jgi:hypothetical protein
LRTRSRAWRTCCGGLGRRRRCLARYAREPCVGGDWLLVRTRVHGHLPRPAPSIDHIKPTGSDWSPSRLHSPGLSRVVRGPARQRGDCHGAHRGKGDRVGGDTGSGRDVTRPRTPESAPIGPHLARLRAVLAPVIEALKGCKLRCYGWRPSGYEPSPILAFVIPRAEAWWLTDCGRQPSAAISVVARSTNSLIPQAPIGGRGRAVSRGCRCRARAAPARPRSPGRTARPRESRRPRLPP